MERYEKLDILGEGQFGTVVKARVKEVRRDVPCKRLPVVAAPG
jgi:hypothetical protein